MLGRGKKSTNARQKHKNVDAETALCGKGHVLGSLLGFDPESLCDLLKVTGLFSHQIACSPGRLQKEIDVRVWFLRSLLTLASCDLTVLRSEKKKKKMEDKI